MVLKDLTRLSLQESLGATVTWPSCAPKKARSLSTVKKIPQSLGLAGHRISVRMVGLCSLLFSLSFLSINLIHRTWESFSQRRRPEDAEARNSSPELLDHDSKYTNYLYVGELRVKTLSWTFGSLRKQKENDEMLVIAVSGIKFSFLQIAF
ncbi:PREDICTED: uncharacterized protein LOC105141496 [Populus euphratica]|uniref:Uncharacterized protein LOC105141496 n=1 Tax=Populus euphratica TaxID=75702 RepID=A0AAJ6Y9I3_POPEU|nr:PREDICTED: uncharacterized protein LOC105141496 [Populus euphratica]